MIKLGMIGWGFSHLKVSLVIALIACLMACSGESVNPAYPDIPATANSLENNSTPPETNSEEDSEVDPDLTVDDLDSISPVSTNSYYRAPDYKKIVNLPLQFITTVSGKKLSVRVTLPANDDGSIATGPFPVVLTQSAYNTNLMSGLLGAIPGNALLGVSDSILVRRGYAQVAVDALGTGASEGGW